MKNLIGTMKTLIPTPVVAAAVVAVPVMRNGMKILNWDDEELRRMVERRELLKRTERSCPSCGSVQVQLVSWYTDDLKLRCRKCKFGFEVKI